MEGGERGLKSSRFLIQALGWIVVPLIEMETAGNGEVYLRGTSTEISVLILIEE